MRSCLSSILKIVLLLLLVSPVAANQRGLRIAVLGDSLAAGYGLASKDAFPARLEAALRGAGLNVTVSNAGVSGDTTAGGLARLDWTLADDPDLVIVELGGNDALRGLDPHQTERNLSAIVNRARQAGAHVVLAGMRAPRNLGRDYYSRFDSLYPRVADRFDVPLYPFFLDGVVGEADLNLGDGLHPNRRGVEVIVSRFLPFLLPLLSNFGD